MGSAKDLWIQMVGLEGNWFPGLGPYVGYPWHFESYYNCNKPFPWITPTLPTAEILSGKNAQANGF